MKRLVSFLLVLVLLMASVPAIAVFDGWKLDYFQDDFGDPTDQFFLYISVPAAVTGAGNIEVAVATVVISENLAAISLDGVYQKIDTSYKEYTVSVKDGKGKKYSFSGKRDNSGVIIVGSGRTDFSLDPTIEKEQKEFDTFCDILVNGGDIQFVVKPLDAPNLKYSFTITATDPIMEKYPTTSAGDFRNGVASVTKLKTGLIDRTGNIIVPYKWKRIDPFLDGLAQVSNGEKIGFIDTTGNLVIPCEWEFAGGFCEGLSTVMKDDKYGYIDKTGKLVIPCEWDYASHFSEGLAWVKKDGKYGYIDKTGKLVIPCEWERANFSGNFSEGLASVKKDGKYGYIDKTGQVVFWIK